MCMCTLCVCACIHCVCVCVGGGGCVRVGGCEELVQYYDYIIIIFEVLMCTFLLIL